VHLLVTLIKVTAIRSVLLRVEDDECEGRNQTSHKYFRILQVLTLNCMVRLSYSLFGIINSAELVYH